MDFLAYLIDVILSGKLFIPFATEELYKELYYTVESNILSVSYNSSPPFIVYYMSTLQIVLIIFFITFVFMFVVKESGSIKNKLKCFLKSSLVMAGIYMILCILIYSPILLHKVNDINGNGQMSFWLLIFAIFIAIGVSIAILSVGEDTTDLIENENNYLP